MTILVCLLAALVGGLLSHFYWMYRVNRWRRDPPLCIDAEASPEQYDWYRHTHKTDPREASHPR